MEVFRVFLFRTQGLNSTPHRDAKRWTTSLFCVKQMVEESKKVQFLAAAFKTQRVVNGADSAITCLCCFTCRLVVAPSDDLHKLSFCRLAIRLRRD